VSGIMRGFDQFMNIVLDKATDDKDGAELGMVVCSFRFELLSTSLSFAICWHFSRSLSLSFSETTAQLMLACGV
jgi:hypothetical protein